MKSQGERLKQLRLDKGLTQAKLAELIGVQPPTVQRYESGKISNMKTPIIEKLSEIFGVSPIYIMGLDLENPSVKIAERFKSVPILGSICAGDGIWCEENYDGRFIIDPSVKNVDFALKIEGESMSGDNIHDGDVALMKSTSYVESGKIAAVLLNDSNEVMLKRVYVKEDHAVLQPSNPEYEPIIAKDFMILGELVAFCHVL